MIFTLKIKIINPVSIFLLINGFSTLKSKISFQIISKFFRAFDYGFIDWNFFINHFCLWILKQVSVYNNNPRNEENKYKRKKYNTGNKMYLL